MLPRQVLDECGEAWPNCLDDEGGGNFVNAANHRGNDNPDGYVDGNSIEASYLYHHADTGQFFMFVNRFYCCRGEDSRYQIMVGRSSSVDRKFYDRNGVASADTVTDTIGTSVIPSDAGGEGFVGLGHAGTHWERGAKEGIFTHHFKASPEVGDQRTLHVWRISIDESGWPRLTPLNKYQS